MSSFEQYLYPLDEWNVRQEQFDPSMVARNETIFSTGNGFFGFRGSFEERLAVYNPGTYLNGFYELSPITHGELAYGYAKVRQTMLNVTDVDIIQLFVEDEPFDMLTGTIHNYEQTIDLRKGVVTRKVVWESPGGKKIKLRADRMVSHARHHLALIKWECEVLEEPCALLIRSSLESNTSNQIGYDDPRMGADLQDNVFTLEKKVIDDSFAAVRYQTKNSGFAIICAMENDFTTDCHYTAKPESAWHEVLHRYQVNAEPGKPVVLNKYISYYTSRRYSSTQIFPLAKNEVKNAKKEGPEVILREQEEYLKEFWGTSDIVLEGDVSLQQSLRFNLFHLLQSAGKNGITSIAAKGLTGEGYGGHYFWDTEIYILPFFIYTQPEMARKLLEYRYRILDKARERAEELGHPGAKYPWRTINGEESSAYFPAGTAQYHINADIIYAVRRYVEITGDIDFLLQMGAEMVVETSRFWLDLGDWIPGKGFCFNQVTGPDEYTVLVDNNTYTNLMAKDHLRYAVEALKKMQSSYSADYRRLQEKVDLKDQEIEDWRKASEGIYLPYSEDLAMRVQDDESLGKAVWDFAGTPREKYPLLLYYHPIVIYRYQVLKQPDLVLALLLEWEEFTMAEKMRIFQYYDPLTTGDSSLSPCIQSVVAADIGDVELAYSYFMKTARMDLDDVNGNVKDGVHTAAMGGTWISLVYGFACMREFRNTLYFRPRLPKQWNRLKFRLQFLHRQLLVDIEKEKVSYTLEKGEEISIYHESRETPLVPKKKIERSLFPEIKVIFIEAGLIKGAMKFIRDCKISGIQCVVVSDEKDLNGLIYEELAHEEKTEELFSLLAGPETIKRGRPDPEIFLNAADTLSVYYKHCLGVESSKEGIEALKAAGMFSVAIMEDESMDEIQGADWILKECADLKLDSLEEEFATFSRNYVYGTTSS